MSLWAELVSENGRQLRKAMEELSNSEGRRRRAADLRVGERGSGRKRIWAGWLLMEQSSVSEELVERRTTEKAGPACALLTWDKFKKIF
ncbi:hypothetical protein TIFTF001_023757 [Ficus carica]|uniref:Uncharacterized protein n=1 Tax=Ficus carica TaxID=3494 RepID=A0AA88AGU0_FICCA|nr:hypothetical protein TIFTF001_023757 [Ficus carica]